MESMHIGAALAAMTAFAQIALSGAAWEDAVQAAQESRNPMGRASAIASVVPDLADHNLLLLSVLQAMAELDVVYGQDQTRALASRQALQIPYAPHAQRDAQEHSALLEHLGEVAMSRWRCHGGSGDGSVPRADSSRRRALLSPDAFKALGGDRLVIVLESSSTIVGEKIAHLFVANFTWRPMQRRSVPRMDLHRYLTRVPERGRDAGNGSAPSSDIGNTSGQPLTLVAPERLAHAHWLVDTIRDGDARDVQASVDRELER